MNPQNRLYDLFLQDTFKIAEKEEWDAIEFISRLRLYMTVTGYEGTLRELLSEHRKKIRPALAKIQPSVQKQPLNNFSGEQTEKYLAIFTNFQCESLFNIL